jgi:hypothetical protein
MNHGLKPHPSTPPGAGISVAVGSARLPGGELHLEYFLSGDIGRIAMRQAAPPIRADGLWRHTCFEAFVRGPGSDAYCEFNFAPSRAWAAYDFDGYRRGMRVPDQVPAPRIESGRTERDYRLAVTLDFSGLAEFAPDAPWRLGLSAVIEATDGRLSYWALNHAPGKPDFHHPDCFALELPPAMRP